MIGKKTSMIVFSGIKADIEDRVPNWQSDVEWMIQAFDGIPGDREQSNSLAMIESSSITSKRENTKRDDSRDSVIFLVLDHHPP